MPALKIIVSAAGRAALRNAQANGTNAVVVASVGVTATAFTATTDTSAIPDEIKRITTITGGATASDTIHVTVSDNSSDSYSVRGIGLYLSDGTLFGSFSQATDLLQKSAQATMLLACDVQFADIDATQLTFGDTNFQLNQATTEKQGLVELATNAEALTGTDNQRALVPAALKAVLDDRFGAGAPSSFVRALLTKASALLFVTALGIRGAASYDTGAGNGLDADKLDGNEGAYYRDYGNLQNVPASFTPSAHQHSAAEITSGVLVVARGGTGLGSVEAGSYLVGNGTNAMQPKTPAQVLTDIGAAPSSHTHAISAVVGLQDALDAKAPLSSPAFTGSPTAPSPATTDNSNRLATTAMVQARFAALINNSPAALDTLKELADALGDDPNFAATMTNALSKKVSIDGFDIITALKTFQSGLEIMGYGTGGAGDCLSLGVVGRLNSTNMYGLGVEPNTMYSKSGSLHRWYIGTNADGGDTARMELSINGLVVNSSDVTKGITTNGVITSGSYFQSSSTGVALAPADTGGVVYLRPNGRTNTTGQVQVLASGNTTVNGAITATGGFQGSDRRLKRSIRDRTVTRGLAINLARQFKQWERRADGEHDVGLIAQEVERLAPWYVRRGEDKHRMRAIDKSGIALECAFDNALGIAELTRALSAMQRRVERLEKHA